LSASVTILGDGQMGLILADLLAWKEVACAIWGPFEAEVARLAATRQSPRMPGLCLPASVAVRADAKAALTDSEVVINAIPTQFMRSSWEKFAAWAPPSAVIACVSKGIEERTLVTPLEIIAHVSLARGRDAADRLVCVSGPTIASELASRKPATMVAASSNAEAALRIQALLGTPWLRIYTHDDVTGVEVAGAAKNVIAIAAGIVDGLDLGFNAKSALLSRGLAEITRLGVSLGARAETFFGVAGVGDLATTCFCPLSRNRTCGERLGRGESLEHILSTTSSVIEGVATTRSIRALARSHGVELPICNAVHGILFEHLQPSQAIARLMEREPKAERVG
jgi:glycerol-3-phosphate dehydrogenase (NAD(P)+)